jgi:MFS family permease
MVTTAVSTHTDQHGARNRLPLIALLTANAISGIGNNLTFLAIPWFVLVTTGSASKTGLTAFAGAVPLVIAGFFGGVIVDRVGHKRVSIVSDIFSGVTVAAIPLLHHTTGLAFWQLLTLVFLGAILDMPGHTARQSLYPDLVALSGVRLERANALASSVNRATQVLGPPLAGGLIAVVGTSNVLWIDALTFAVSASVVALGVPARFATASAARTQHGEPATPGNARRELLEGLRFIRQDRLILALMVTFACGAALAEPLYSVVMPVYAREVYGSALDLGLLYAALGIGSLGGNIVFAAVGHRLPRRATFIVGWAVRAASFWLLITLPSLPVFFAAVVINGFCFEPGNPLFTTLMQERVPPELRGRVLAGGIAGLRVPATGHRAA